MKCLSVNTAGKILSISIVDDDKVLYLFEEPERKGQGNNLVGYIRKAMAETSVSFDDIGLMSVVTGPGSFTGIRVGIAAMRGYALASGIDVIGVSAFDMFAKQTADKINIIAIESWREELYFAFKDENGKDILEPVNISPANLKEYLSSNGLDGREYIFSGDATDKLRDIFSESEFADCSNINAATVAFMAISKKCSGKDFSKPVPYYLRSADVSVSCKIQQRTIGE